MENLTYDEDALEILMGSTHADDPQNYITNEVSQADNSSLLNKKILKYYKTGGSNEEKRSFYSNSLTSVQTRLDFNGRNRQGTNQVSY